MGTRRMASRRVALKLLGLDAASSFGAIDLKHAYLKRARVLHPDAKTAQSDHASFLAVKDAYDTLAQELRSGAGQPLPHVPMSWDIEDELSRSLMGILGDRDAISGVNEMFATGVQPELRDTGGMWQMAEMMRAQAVHDEQQASRRVSGENNTLLGAGGQQEEGGEMKEGPPLNDHILQQRQRGSKRKRKKDMV